jgi:hypothetical protein
VKFAIRPTWRSGSRISPIVFPPPAAPPYMQMSAGFEETRSEVRADLTSRRFSSPLLRGTEGSNPVPSSGESIANSQLGDAGVAKGDGSQWRISSARGGDTGEHPARPVPLTVRAADRHSFEPLATTLVSSAPHPCFGAQRGYATRSSSSQVAGLRQIMGMPFAARLGALVKTYLVSGNCDHVVDDRCAARLLSCSICRRNEWRPF